MTFDPQKHMTKLKGKDYLEAENAALWSFARAARALVQFGSVNEDDAIADIEKWVGLADEYAKCCKSLDEYEEES